MTDDFFCGVDYSNGKDHSVLTICMPVNENGKSKFCVFAFTVHPEEGMCLTIGNKNDRLYFRIVMRDGALTLRECAPDEVDLEHVVHPIFDSAAHGLDVESIEYVVRPNSSRETPILRDAPADELNFDPLPLSPSMASEFGDINDFYRAIEFALLSSFGIPSPFLKSKGGTSFDLHIGDS